LALATGIFARVGGGWSEEKRTVLDLFAEDLGADGGIVGAGEEAKSRMFFL